jgi:AhpD family alkylhydroperoxidase
MTPLPAFETLSPAAYKAFLGFAGALRSSRIEAGLIDLINIRASQMNGCAFCVDMHVKEATIRGERPLRLHHVTIWRESTLFSARERAALEWTETLTRLTGHGVPDSIRDAVRAELSDEELSDLTFAIMAINGWNRVSIGFAAVPGSKDAAYGIANSGLS